MKPFKILLVVAVITLAACTSTSPTLSGSEAEQEARELTAATAQVFGVDVSRVIVSNISKRKMMGGYMLTTTYFDAVVAGTKYRCKVEGTMFELLELTPACVENDANTDTPQITKANNNNTAPSTTNSPSKTYSALNPEREQIQKVQSVLNDLGYSAGVEDGIMGKKTSAAIAAFQQDNGIDTSGELNDETIEALRSAWLKM